MVRHGEFLERLASVFGEDVSTFTLAYRLLREQAVVLEGKRGRHAPGRTPRDAAALWCWIGVTEKPGLAPTAVKDFGFSPHLGGSSGTAFLEALGLEARNHTLLEALTALIVAEAAGKQLAPYDVEFAPDELSVAISSVERHRYSRDRDDPPVIEGSYGRPYRVVRTFPRELVQQIAAMFRRSPGDA